MCSIRKFIHFPKMDDFGEFASFSESTSVTENSYGSGAEAKKGKIPF